MELLVDITKKLPDFTLEVCFKAGKDTLGILGASGSGKSMTLRCLAGLVKPDRGKIILNGRVLFDSEKGINLKAQERNIGFLFQNYALFPHLTVAENIAFGLGKLSKKSKARIIAEKLAMVHLVGLEDRYPSQLSGGQQQRAALARALAMEPEVLLLDEPFSALDNHLRNQMEQQLIESLAAYHGITLFVTHNLDESYRVCKHLLVMSEGKGAAYGTKESLFLKPPKFTVAQLTGCKNLSRANLVSADQVEAADWGCNLSITQPIPPNLTHVGIRAHHLSFVEDAGLNNAFPCWVSQTTEAPHQVTLYLSLNQPPQNQNDYHLQAEIYKEQFARLRGRPFPWFVRLEPELLFLMEG